MKFTYFIILIVFWQAIEFATGFIGYGYWPFGSNSIFCQRKTVTFNSNFVEFMLAFLGINRIQCACSEPCLSVAKYVKLYIYHANTNRFVKLRTDGTNAHLIDRSKTTTIFVHGYTDSFRPQRNAWNNQLSRMESKIFQTNAIAVDWSKLSRCSYEYAVDYLVPEIGFELTRLLKIVLRVDLHTVNCVGHSLGAHVCGYSSAAGGGKFKRCFGLDPAGIGYSSYDGPPRGLNRTTCQYVQAIHTDVFVGSKQAMGHADFYPNNRTGVQPHCILQATGCPHQAVVEYYKAALNPKNKFIGRSCDRRDLNLSCKFGPHNRDNCGGVTCFDTAPCAPYALTDSEIF